MASNSVPDSPQPQVTDPSVVNPSASAPTGSGPIVPDDVASLPYEAARDELVALVARLESGQVGLEESVRLWQRGEALAAHCEGWLDRAEAALGRPDGSLPG